MADGNFTLIVERRPTPEEAFAMTSSPYSLHYMARAAYPESFKHYDDLAERSGGYESPEEEVAADATN